MRYYKVEFQMALADSDFDEFCNVEKIILDGFNLYDVRIEDVKVKRYKISQEDKPIT